MNNIQDLITGNAAIDYINVTTIIVNSIVIFGSLILFIFFLLNIVLKIFYFRIQKTINLKYSEYFMKFPNGQAITLEQLYTSQKLKESKVTLDNEFQEFWQDLKNSEKKIIIFKKIIQILKTLVIYEFRYRKFSRIINALRIIYIIFSSNNNGSTSSNSNNVFLLFQNCNFQINIVDSKCFEIIFNPNTNNPFKFSIKFKRNTFILVNNDEQINNYSKDAINFINSFLDETQKNIKKVKRYMKKSIFIFNKNNWVSSNAEVVENSKKFISNKYKKITNDFYVIKLKNSIFKYF